MKLKAPKRPFQELKEATPREESGLELLIRDFTEIFEKSMFMCNFDLH
jgi:hypothetical protein